MTPTYIRIIFIVASLLGAFLIVNKIISVIFGIVLFALILGLYGVVKNTLKKKSSDI